MGLSQVLTCFDNILVAENSKENVRLVSKQEIVQND